WVAGVVHDSTGAAVAAASVVVRPVHAGVEVRASTSADGRFAVTVPHDVVDVIVDARGFGRAVQRITPQDGVEPRFQVEMTLQPATVLEEVTVTASRTDQRLGDVPA